MITNAKDAGLPILISKAVDALPPTPCTLIRTALVDYTCTRPICYSHGGIGNCAYVRFDDALA